MKRIWFLLHALLALFTLPISAAPEYPKMGADIYDTTADGSKLIAAALTKATADHKNVLLVFGANWCIWCHRLHATFEKEPVIAKLLAEKFEVVMIDVNTQNGTKRNADVDKRYGNPTKNGLPVIVVLDATGKPLTTQDTGKLEVADKHDPKKVIAFLERWAPKKS